MNRNYKFQLKCTHCHKTYIAEQKTKATLCPACLIIDKQQIEKEKKEEKRRAEEEKKRKQSDFSVPKLGYDFELFKLNSKNLSLFAFLDNRRKIIGSQVASLYRLLCDGKHFDSPIVVNKREEMFWLIDGNHRLEAFKKMLQIYPTFSMDVLLVIYKNLDSDAEIEAFRRWNTGKVQSIDDFIQSIARKTPFIQWLKSDFPVRIVVYKKPDTISVRLLCNALLAALRDDESGHGLRRRKFQEDIQQLREVDYEFAKGWITRFTAIFGTPSRGSPYYTTTFFTASMCVAYRYQDKKDLDDRFREKVLGDSDILDLTKFGGKTANKKMVGLLREKMRIAQ